ncbi:hypothetical protein ACFUJ0_02210 [Streptomyces sp. NPDC057242]|uniref:hypothetical protein n=1 Tax=unclassified Streptomyces TaxID=2593676 RepID=UPI0036266CC8
MTQSAAAPGTAAGCVPRPATADDAAEITRLRSQLVLSEPLDEEWLDVCRDRLASRLRPGAMPAPVSWTRRAAGWPPARSR